jgi:hypothetical protein
VCKSIKNLELRKYLFQGSKQTCACQPDGSAKFVDHLGVPWSTSYLGLSPGEFVLVISVSLVDEFLGFFM